MELIITLRKEVADRETGDDIFELVKQRLQDKPGIRITGMVNNHFEGLVTTGEEPE